MTDDEGGTHDLRIDDDPLRIGAGLPAWADAVVDRLEFYATRRGDQSEALDNLRRLVEQLRIRASEPNGNERMLDRFVGTCIDLLAEAADSKPELSEVRKELKVLCEMARTALATDRDDRPLLPRTREIMDLPGMAGWAGRVPGRVVWLAALYNDPEEAGGAASMLVNDLAAVGRDLPLRALQAAAEDVRTA